MLNKLRLLGGNWKFEALMTFRPPEDIPERLRGNAVQYNQCSKVDKVQNDNAPQLCAMSREIFCDEI